MSLKTLSVLLIVGFATADLGQKGYSPIHNIKIHGNPFGPVAFNNLGVGGLGTFGSYYGNGYPIYGGYGNGIFNLGGQHTFGGYGGIGFFGGYPGYGYHNGLGYNGIHKFGGYGMSKFGGLNGMSGMAGYGIIGYGTGGYGGYGMGSYGGYGKDFGKKFGAY